MKMDTLQSFLAQVDAAHAQSCRECDAAFEESVRWLDETVAANKRTLAAQTNEIGLAYPAAAKANPPARKRRGLQTVGEEDNDSAASKENYSAARQNARAAASIGSACVAHAADTVALDPPPPAKRKSGSDDGADDAPREGRGRHADRPSAHAPARADSPPRASPRDSREPTSGPTRSAELAQRVAPAPELPDVSLLNVKQLREELKQRDLSSRGLKAELVARLQEALVAEAAACGVSVGAPTPAPARASAAPAGESDIDWAQIAQSGLKSNDVSPRQHVTGGDGAGSDRDGGDDDGDGASASGAPGSGERGDGGTMEVDPPADAPGPNSPPALQLQHQPPQHQSAQQHVAQPPRPPQPSQRAAQQARRRRSDLCGFAPPAASMDARVDEPPQPSFPPPAVPSAAAPAPQPAPQPAEQLADAHDPAAARGGTVRARLAPAAPTVLPIPAPDAHATMRALHGAALAAPSPVDASAHVLARAGSEGERLTDVGASNAAAVNALRRKLDNLKANQPAALPAPAPVAALGLAHAQPLVQRHMPSAQLPASPAAPLTADAGPSPAGVARDVRTMADVPQPLPSPRALRAAVRPVDQSASPTTGARVSEAPTAATRLSTPGGLARDADLAAAEAAMGEAGVAAHGEAGDAPAGGDARVPSPPDDRTAGPAAQPAAAAHPRAPDARASLPGTDAPMPDADGVADADVEAELERLAASAREIDAAEARADADADARQLSAGADHSMRGILDHAPAADAPAPAAQPDARRESGAMAIDLTDVNLALAPAREHEQQPAGAGAPSRATDVAMDAGFGEAPSNVFGGEGKVTSFLSLVRPAGAPPLPPASGKAQVEVKALKAAERLRRKEGDGATASATAHAPPTHGTLAPPKGGLSGIARAVGSSVLSVVGGADKGAADARRRRLEEVQARKQQEEEARARALEDKDRAKRERDAADARRKAAEEDAKRKKAQDAATERSRRLREEADRRAAQLAEREAERREKEELFRRKKEFDEAERKRRAGLANAPAGATAARLSDEALKPTKPTAASVLASASAAAALPLRPIVTAQARAMPPPPPAAAAAAASSAAPPASKLPLPAGCAPSRAPPADDSGGPSCKPSGSKAGSNGSLANSDGSGGYPISDHKSSDEEDEEEDEDEEYVNPAKKVPAWAAPDALQAALQRQLTADPDDIFSNVETCDLVDIFAPPGKPTKERYHRRGSSGNWKADQLTWREVHEYNQAMGYYKGEHG